MLLCGGNHCNYMFIVRKMFKIMHVKYCDSLCIWMTFVWSNHIWSEQPHLSPQWSWGIRNLAAERQCSTELLFCYSRPKLFKYITLYPKFRRFVHFSPIRIHGTTNEWIRSNMYCKHARTMKNDGKEEGKENEKRRNVNDDKIIAASITRRVT